MTRQIIATSQEAYHSLKHNDIAEIYKRILGALKILGTASSEQIANHLTIEPAKVWKRMSELERDQKIYNTKLRTVNKSGRSAFMYSLSGEGKKDSAVEKNHYTNNQKSAGTIASDIIHATQQRQLFD